MRPNLIRFLILPILLLTFVLESISQTDDKKLFNDGVQLMNGGNVDQAIEKFNEVLKIDSVHINAILKRGYCYILQKKFEEAIKDFDKAIMIEPQNNFAYTSRGSAKMKIKKFEEAIEDYNYALKINPEDTEALNNRGFAKKSIEDYDGACEDWKLSKKMGNQEAKIYLINNKCR